MRDRLIASSLLLAAILFLPYWVYVPLLFLAMLLIPFFWEGVLFGFLIDTLFGPGTSLPFSSMAIASAVFLIVMLPLRERLRWKI